MNTSKIYVDIQSLLDLRQSALVTLMGEEKAAEYVNTDAYNFRDLDKFPVDMKEYEKIMKDPSGKIFKHATITYVEVAIRNKLQALEKISGFNGESPQPELVVNTYPYQLTKQQVNALQTGIFVKFGKECLVTMVYDSPALWGPAYFKNNKVICAFIYDFTEWMNLHGEALPLGEMRETGLFCPAIGKNELTPEEQKAFAKLGFNDVYAYTEYVLASACRVQFLPIVFYSNIITATVILDKNKTIVESQVEKYRQETKDLAEDIVNNQEVKDDDLSESNQVPR